MSSKIHFTRAQFTEARNSVSSITELARKLKCAEVTAYRYMRVWRIKPFPPRKRGSKPQYSREKVLAKFNQTKSIHKTAIFFGCSTSTVRRIIGDLAKSNRIDESEIFDGYRQGKLVDYAVKLGVSESTVRSRLRYEVAKRWKDKTNDIEDPYQIYPRPTAQEIKVFNAAQEDDIIYDVGQDDGNIQKVADSIGVPFNVVKDYLQRALNNLEQMKGESA